MENAVDAIKIAFGIFIFVIALALAVSVIGQARATSDIIFHMNDKTEFYEYIKDGDVNAEERIVGINTVIPTIHRYAQEDIAVSIYYKDGTPIVRYDLWTEGFMANWDEIVRLKEGVTKETYNQIEARLRIIQGIVNETLKKYGENVSEDMDVESIIDKFYTVTSDFNNNIKHGAPWSGHTDKVFERIKADMVGENVESNNIKYQGKDLSRYKDKQFIEKFVEITTSGEVITEDDYSLETIKGNKKLEIIYIMQ